MRGLVVLAVLVTASGAIESRERPVVARMATTPDCGYVEFCAGDGHKFSTFLEANENPHGYCIGPCDTYEGGGVCHPVCRDWFDDEPQLRAGYEAIIAAANAGDVDAVVSLSTAFPKHVGYNRARHSVQVLNCDGTGVVANLPLRASAVVNVTGMPDAEVIFAGGEERR